MLTSSTSDLTHNSLNVTHSKEYKFFSKSLIKRELSISNLSSMEDHYHGGSSVSVPFMWESQPGTPKIKLRESPLPPLTPPPSYCYSHKTPSSKISSPNISSARKKTSKPNLLKTIFPKHNFSSSSTRTSKNFPSSPSLSPSSSSSHSSSRRSAVYYASSVPCSSASNTSKYRGRRRIMSPSHSRRLSVDSRADDDDENEEYNTSPVSTLCFGRGANARSRTTGCYSSLIKVLLN